MIPSKLQLHPTTAGDEGVAEAHTEEEVQVKVETEEKGGALVEIFLQTTPKEKDRIPHRKQEIQITKVAMMFCLVHFATSSNIQQEVARKI